MIYIILVIILLIILRVMVLRNRRNTVHFQCTQTCSDIRGIKLNIKSGIYSLSGANSFGLDVPNGLENRVKSEIKNGVWHINADMGDDFAHIGICIPSVLTADEITVDADVASVVISGISAKKMSANISSGRMEINSVNAEKALFKCGAGCFSVKGAVVDELETVCGEGKMLFDGAINSNAQFGCGAGQLEAGIENDIKEYNIYTQNGVGTVKINEEDAPKEINNNSSRKIKLDCGAGSIFVNFKKDMGSVNV